MFNLRLTPRRRWRVPGIVATMFDIHDAQVGHNLLIAILVTNVLLAAGFYVLGDLSFSRGWLC